MGRFFTGICGVLALLASCRIPSPSSSWTVMTWNVQNLFDGIDDGNEYPEFDPGTDDWNDRLYRRRLDRTGDVLLAAVDGGADVLVLQELEKPGILDDLAEGPLRGRGYRWRLAVPGYGIIRCGVLSRYPIRDVVVADCGLWNGRSLRPVLQFCLESPDGPVTVFAVHWKSPRDGREPTEAARIREARILHGRIAGVLEVHPDRPVLLLGDWNTPGDAAVRPAALAPAELRTADGGGPAILYRSPDPDALSRSGDVPVFYDPEPAGAPGGTYVFRDRWERPDRILVDPNFVESLGPGRCRVGGAEVMADGFGRPYRWISDIGEGYSDHLPLLLIVDPGDRPENRRFGNDEP